ncbi:MAG: YfhO family protein [Lachnospiraceae bacterium]
MNTKKPGTWLQRNYIYLLSFMIPVVIMITIFIARSIFPFGDRSFLHVDMYHQYFPFLTEFYHKLKSGDSLLYSWNTGIGSNFLALFVYYLSSPFNWLSVLIPEPYLIEFMTYLVVFKIGLCGLTFAVYLKNHYAIAHPGIIFFAVFYALSGYMAAYNWNVMWLDCLFLAPIIILGLERLVKEGKCNLYCIALGLSILSNYYISIMICIFLVLYFLVLLVNTKEKGKACLRFTIYSLLAGGMAAVLLLPELEMLGLTEFTNSDFPSKLTSYFSFWDVLSRHCMTIDVEIGLKHWPNIYCGVAVFFLFPLYVMCRKIPLREKFPKVLLLVFLLISFSYNIPDFIWHGFNYPDSLPARQSFLYIFLLLTLCFEAFLHLREFSHTEICRVFFGAAVFLLLCEKLVTKDTYELTTAAFLITAVVLLLYAVLIYYDRHHVELTNLLWLCALSFVILEAGINTAIISVPTVSRTDYLASHDELETLTARCKESDPDFYRMDKYKRLTQNDAMLIGYPSASLFSSTSNALVKEFYETYGMKSSRVFYSFEGATPLTSALLSTKYMFSNTKKETDSLYKLVDQEADTYLYQNTYSLPLGYVIDSDLHEVFSDDEVVQSVLSDGSHETSAERALNPIERQNLLASHLGMDETIFEELSVMSNETNAAISTFSTIEVMQDAHIYALVGNKKVNTVTASFNGTTETFKKLKNAYILDLGYHTAGSTVTLTGEEEASLSLSAYALNETNLATLIDTLSAHPMVIDSYDSTHILGHVAVAEAGNLVLSIGYEPGWHVTVDGVETEVNLFENAMISVPLTAGEHTIALTFYPNSLTIGAIISAICLLLFLAVTVYVKRSRAVTAVSGESMGSTEGLPEEKM